MISNDDKQIRNNVLVNFHHFPLDAQFMISDRIAIRKAGEFPLHAEIIARSASGVINSDVPVQAIRGEIQNRDYFWRRRQNQLPIALFIRSLHLKK